MKKVLLILFTHVIIYNSFAQKAELALDEKGKYTYYELVDNQKVVLDTLISRSKLFFKQMPKKTIALKKQLNDTAFYAEGKFVINKSALVLSRPSGEVLYNFVAELRNGKYRYWLTDFKFVPYQRDRYGNFVPATSVKTPLEKSPGKLADKEWKSYISNAAEQAKNLGSEFKRYLAGQVFRAAEKDKAKTLTKEW